MAHIGLRAPFTLGCLCVGRPDPTIGGHGPPHVKAKHALGMRRPAAAILAGDLLRKVSSPEYKRGRTASPMATDTAMPPSKPSVSSQSIFTPNYHGAAVRTGTNADSSHQGATGHSHTFSKRHCL